MKTFSHIIAIIAILMPVTASANVYEDRLLEAFNNITAASTRSAGHASKSTHYAFYSPQGGECEGQLDYTYFKLDSKSGQPLIDRAVKIYERISEESDKGKISKAELYTLWWSTANLDRSYSGYRLYYNSEKAILVGSKTDNCYTVGFVAPEDSKHRTTYTIEWSVTNDGDSLSGRVVTTYAPIKTKPSVNVYTLNADSLDGLGGYKLQLQAGMKQYREGMEQYRKGMEQYQDALENAQSALEEAFPEGQSRSYSYSYSSSSSSTRDAQKWMQKMLFYIENVQDDSSAHYMYLSKLYDLCKNTDCLDQMDLKIASQQLNSVYQQLKAKSKLKDNELTFLQSMVELLESKIKK